MKTRRVLLLLGSIALLSTPHLSANGVVNFSNLGSAPEDCIYVGSWSTFVGFTPVFDYWSPCQGNACHIALYWGPQGTPALGLTQIGATSSFITGGLFSGGNRTIPSPEAGPVVTLQVRAWQPIPGIPDTYEAVAAVGMGPFGAGPTFDLKTKDPIDVLTITPRVSDAAGWSGFIFAQDGVTIPVPVPEPSTILLSILGLTAVLLLRRRR